MAKTHKRESKKVKKTAKTSNNSLNAGFVSQQYCLDLYYLYEAMKVYETKTSWYSIVFMLKVLDSLLGTCICDLFNSFIFYFLSISFKLYIMPFSDRETKTKSGMRDKSTIKRLLMYKGSKPIR